MKRKIKKHTKEMNLAFYGPEPSFAYDHNLNKMEYILSLNWYAATITNEESKDYVTTFLKEQKNKSFAKKVQKVPHLHFSTTYGAIARMLSNDLLIPDSGSKWLDNNLNRLIDDYTPVEEVVDKKQKVAKVNIQARMDAKARAIAGEIDDIFEDQVWFVATKLEPNLIYNFLHAKNVPSIIAQRVGDLFGPHLDELKSVKKDPQLIEAYASYSKADLKRFVAFYQDVVDTCATFAANAKKAKVRKPRAKKTISADKKISKLKYLKLYNVFQLASVNPTKVIGASQVWLFNTKYTKLTVLNAVDRGGIDVKGQSFLNVDAKNSFTKKAGRNTKDVITSIVGASKPQCRKTLENITAKPGKLQTRSNSDTVIVRVF